jgi:hypothetical protein
MSYLYAQDPREQAKLLDQALMGPAAEAPTPGFFDGGMEAGFTGAFSGVVAKPALLLGDAITAPLAAGARDAGMDGVAEWLEAEQQKNVTMLKSLRDRQSSYGTAGNVMYGVADVIPQAIGGAIAGAAVAGPAGGVVGGAAAPALIQGYADARMAMEDGVNLPTAVQKGAITGVTMGVGAALPMSLGVKTLQSALFGAGTNIGLGMVQRGATASLLEANGYGEMASQYQWLDKEAIAVDAILGAAFGALGAKMARPPKTADVDAALIANEKLHVEMEAQPGVHTSPESRDAGTQAFEKAVADMMVNGEMPDVARLAADMDVVPNPETVRFHAELAKELDAEIPRVEEPVSVRAPEPEVGAGKMAADVPPAEAPKPHDGTPEGMARAGDVQPVERDMARQIMDAHPDLEVPGANGPRRFADVIAEADAEIATAQKDSLLHEVAVACFLRG